ncbi:hypothetical protein DEJ50_12570 [Streptomyces venezuelae]|uniref:Glycerophosphoryl diester phosphodiesterase membrane domain-containing protein n=1 Tax=Streptomyces venezuelae TaxID=54571 RepID=A0A5P2D196_STRVZ|nr:hypothetical protein [Streptomyces venezuelae]QES48533.1 hypothetical protein DEJ50_12570 [Streptomyces venezuelae]
MNDSPGWASPGSDPSDGEKPAAGPQPTPSERPDANPASKPDPDSNADAKPKWSAEQPPPGQWSNPGTGQTPPPAAPQPGTGWGSYGQQPGRPPYAGPYGTPGGPGGWGKPPAAKPGVIPLRPLGVGEILDGAVTTMRTHWRSVLPITMAVAVIIQLISLTLQRTVLSEFMVVPDEDATPEEVLDSLGGTMVVTLTDSFIQLVGSVIVTAILTMIFSRAVLGQASSIGQAWRGARPQLLKLAGLALLLTVGALVVAAVLMLPGLAADSTGLIVFGLIVALGLIAWLWIKFALASPALMLERGSIPQSLRRSSKLVGGSWWRIFGISVLTNVITGFVGGTIVAVFAFIGSLFTSEGASGFLEGTAVGSWPYLIIAGIGGVIALTIVLPMQAGVTVLLYIDQRIRREALDLELARAAGVENYGDSGSQGDAHGGNRPPAGG